MPYICNCYWLACVNKNINAKKVLFMSFGTIYSCKNLWLRIIGPIERGALRAFSDGGVTSWELCVLCKKQSEEELVCPLSNPIHQRRESAYKEVISLADQFLMLNIEMKSPCEKILHPDTINAVSCTI